MVQFANQVPVARGPIGPATLPVGRTIQYATPDLVPADTRTGEGGTGWSRDAEGELFLLGASFLWGKAEFYEGAGARERRFVELVRDPRVSDAFLRGFLPWVRQVVGIRTAAIVGAAEYVAGRRPGGRQLVAGTLTRADEPAELLAYWVKRHGKAIPKPLKRGVADALTRLVDEYAALKYAGTKHSMTLARAVRLTHPAPKAAWQSALFRYLVGRDLGKPASDEELALLPRVAARVAANKRALEGEVADAETVKAAHGTWEWSRSQGSSWADTIDAMPPLAVLRNLRNLEAQNDAELIRKAATVLENPARVRRSLAMPLQVLEALQHVTHPRLVAAVNAALDATVDNVPALEGASAVLVDVSASMSDQRFGSSMHRFNTAAVFGAAVALRSGPDTLLGAFSDDVALVPFVVGGGLTPVCQNLRAAPNFGRGTRLLDAVSLITTHARAAGVSLRRVVVLTDEQTAPPYHGYSAGYRVTDVAGGLPVYTWNVAGYAAGWLPPVGNYHCFGGLGDGAFKMLELLERGRDAAWPWDLPAG